MSDIERISECSQYLATLLRRDDECSSLIVSGNLLQRRYPLIELYRELLAKAQKVESFKELLGTFRRFKQLHFVRIAGRDLLGTDTLAETMAQVSELAGVSLQVGLDILSRHPEWWAGNESANTWEELRPQLRLVVMGMGKLGGHELNYVSDIDLLYLYGFGGQGEVLPAHAPFLLGRLFQRLGGLLSDIANGDRVFLVDMRLRPQGKDGELFSSAAAASDHYLNSGRAWERQALLKARPVAGDRPLGMHFLQDVHPFIFRRFLDYQALDEIRDMRDKILFETAKSSKGRQPFDVKLGIGGIREIEFLVQSFQLIYGGRRPELDEPNTLKCLERLKTLGLIDEPVVAELRESYVFLRRVEHWIQLDQNRQTQKLPDSEGARNRLALAMGFDGDDTRFMKHLADCCAAVHRRFVELFHSDTETCSVVPGGDGDETESEFSKKVLERYPSEEMKRFEKDLCGFPAVVRRTVFNVLMRFAASKDHDTAEKAFLRLGRYFAKVSGRPALMRIFHSSGSWLEDVCRGIAQSELISELLIRHPGVVEGPATTGGIFPEDEDWAVAGTQVLDRAVDFEEALEWLRRFKNERILETALGDLRGDLGQEDVESRLTALADFFVRHTWWRVREKAGLDDTLPLAVLGLGKLGSGEMSYLSDLDLVFVYDPLPGEVRDRIPENIVGLVQRFMRMLSTPLYEGPGYEVDARLRPEGRKGLLIVTRESWLRYYEDNADLWEIQALLRMRCVAGHGGLCQWIEERAQEICYQPRDPEKVWERLCGLRARMQRERAEEKGETVDLKLGMGGLVDLEFLVQGIQLVHGHENSQFQKGSVRAVLPSVVESVLKDEPGAGFLVQAFRAIRALDHRLRLGFNSGSARPDPRKFENLCGAGLWPPTSGGEMIEDWTDLLILRKRVRTVLERFCSDLP